MSRRSRCSLALSVVSSLMFLSATAHAQTVVGVGAGAFFEDSKLTGLERIAVQEEEQTYDYRSHGFLSGGLWFLFQLSQRVRVGSAIDYYGSYISATKCQEGECEDPEFEPDLYEFGKLLEFYARVEYALPVLQNIDMILGGVAGTPILFPGGNLDDEIDGLQEQGAGVLSLPKIGYVVGPNLGARWKYSDHLSVRSDLFVKWEQIFIFRTTQEIDGIGFKKNWTTGTLRYELALGIEVAL